MSIKLDLHVHSASRGKIYIGTDGLRNSLRNSGLDGVAITNFFDISHAVWLKKKLIEYVIIVGQEILSNDGHIIGLGLEEKISDLMSAEETVSHIHEQGGIAVAPHPYILGVGKKLQSLQIDAVESYNAYIGPTILPNYLAARTAIKRKIPQTASTDTTSAEFVGRSYTDVMVADRNSVMDGIRSGKVRLCKRPMPVPVAFTFKSIFNKKNLEPWGPHAIPCFICGKSTAPRIFKEKFKCIDCGKMELSRIACCNGHYLCMKCLVKRGEHVPESSMQLMTT